jgi:catechol 2,3-dioxygenase-like lactoylglutathione lyase family enzyme
MPEVLTPRRLFALLAAAAMLPAQQPVSRPKVLGIAHMAIYVKDLAQTRQFYEQFLGFGEPFTLPPKGQTEGVRIAFVKVNEHQYIEIFNEADRGEGQLNHISIYTDDAGRMRDYLKANGIEPMGNAATGPVPKGQTGNKNYNVKDPDGHIVEIVEYQPDSWTAQHAGRDMPPGRIADSVMHVGFLVGDLAKSQHFYGDILGFQETWRGGGNPKSLSWVNMRVPDGKDYVEFMLYSKLPEPDARGTKNHMSLMVPDAQKALEELKRREGRGLYHAPEGKPMEIQIGVNRKRQINLYDPDGTRIELMEPQTVDGKPAPSSTAPPPHSDQPGK